jgi:sodium/proline symporter
MSQINPTLVTFLVYIIAMVGIGLYAYKSTNNFDDYILGGRSLGSFVTALSAGASDMSGWLLMGLPGAIFLSGLSEMWIGIGLNVQLSLAVDLLVLKWQKIYMNLELKCL